MWLLELMLLAAPLNAPSAATARSRHGPWPPLDVTNSTLQKAFASDPPLKDWLHDRLHHARPITWSSVDDLLIDYVQWMKHALFMNDIVTIDAEDQGELAKAAKEFNARVDPLNHNGSVSSKRRVQL